MPLKIYLDTAQRRVKTQRVAAFVQGSYPAERGKLAPGWDDRYGSDTFFDPATFTLMLRPYCLTSTWATSNTGNYAKLALASFTLTPSSGWEEHDVLGNGAQKFLHLADSTEPKSGVTTSSVLAKNQGFYAAFCNYTPATQREIPAFAVGAVGPSGTASTSTGVWVQFYAGGRADVLKNGDVVGSYSVRGDAQGQPGVTQGFIEVVIIPGRFRELLVICPTTGGAFSHVFEDIEETATDPEITPAGKLAFIVPTGAATVLLSDLKFPTSGYGISQVIGLAERPNFGRSGLVRRFWDDGAKNSSGGALSAGSVAYGLVKAEDPSTAYDPSNATHGQQVRMQVTFTSGSGISTPFVHAGLIEWPLPSGVQNWVVSGPGEVASTPAVNVDMTPVCQSLSFDVPDDPSGVSVTFSARNQREDDGTDTFGTLFLDRPFQTPSRPFALQMDGVTIVDGIVGRPHRDYSRFRDVAEWEGRDSWWILEETRIRDPLPLDGLTIPQAIRALLAVAGISDTTASPVSPISDIFDDGFTVPRGPSPSTGEWGFLVDVGPDSTVASWIRRFMEVYAADWWYGFRPGASGPVFWAYPESELPITPVADLYATIEQAISAGAPTPERYVWRNYRDEMLEPECNVLRVTGWDARLQVPFQVFISDDASRDPTLTPRDRPANWLGYDQEAGYLDPLITNEAVATRLCEKFFPVLSTPTTVAQWDAELVVRVDNGLPAWRGDCVRIWDKDNVSSLYRITTLSCQVRIEPDGSTQVWQDRPTAYTAKYISA